VNIFGFCCLPNRSYYRRHSDVPSYIYLFAYVGFVQRIKDLFECVFRGIKIDIIREISMNNEKVYI
jgi:hypothetical protein